MSAVKRVAQKGFEVTRGLPPGLVDPVKVRLVRGHGRGRTERGRVRAVLHAGDILGRRRKVRLRVHVLLLALLEVPLPPEQVLDPRFLRCRRRRDRARGAVECSGNGEDCGENGADPEGRTTRAKRVDCTWSRSLCAFPFQLSHASLAATGFESGGPFVRGEVVESSRSQVDGWWGAQRTRQGGEGTVVSSLAPRRACGCGSRRVIRRRGRGREKRKKVEGGANRS